MPSNRAERVATTGTGSFLVVETVETDDELWFLGSTAEAAVRIFGGCGDLDRTISRPVLPLGVTGDHLLFTATCRGGFAELWASDGTKEGTRLLIDEATSFLGSLSDGRALLATSGVTRPPVLRVTDGTLEGTAQLANNLDIYSLPAAALGDGAVLAVARDPFGFDLWQTDGTAEGTEFAVSFPAGWAPIRSSSLGDRLAVFVVKRDSTVALWRTDGSAAGSFLIPVGPGFQVSAVHTDGARASFFVDRPLGGGTDLVLTDGSVRGTRVFALPSRFRYPSDAFTAVGGRVYWRDPVAGRLASSNLTDAGTGLLELTPVISLGAFFRDTPAGTLLVAARPEAGVDVWRLDGSTTPQKLAAGCRPGGTPPCTRRFLLPAVTDEEAPYRFFDFPFSAGELRFWETDGTASGTRVTGTVAVPGPLDGDPAAGLVPDERQFLARSASGLEWFRTDGTSAGTVRGLEVGVIARGDGANPLNLVAAGGRVYFVAKDDDNLGIWSSDGTVAGTTALSVPSPDFGNAEDELVLTSVGNHVVIRPKDSFDGVEDLFVSDGTELGTRELDSPGTDPFVQSRFVLGGEFLTEIGFRLFRTRLAEGSSVLEPLVNFEGSGSLGSAVNLGNVLYFPRGDQGSAQLWRTDGTAPGTTVVAEVAELSLFSLVAWGGGLAAFAGNRILISDGTPAGTRLLAGPWSGSFRSLVGTPSFLFFTAGGRLYRSDGTAAGTVEISRHSGLLVPFRDGVAFVGFDPAAGTELWATDSPPNGVHRVADLWPGPAGSFPADLAVIGDRLFFRATDGVHGWEAWVTDGTAAGTSRLTDLHPGLASSNPRSFTRLGSEVLFTADDGESGRELWALPLAAVGEPFVPGPEPVPAGEWLTSPEVPGFRFKVRIGEFNALDGRLEPACLGETLCVSGALPGRVEALLRVVGPKPNGFLWPTLVKLTTSRVEIWIEQQTTGEIRSYVLPSARGDADLPALFDRLGFRPSRLVFEGSAASIGDGTPPPPGVRWLTSPALPGFRVAIQVATPTGSIPARGENPCLEETLCASGIVPGRSEVLVRVVGPRPNGFLWPTIARFTTSGLDVWIEQLATGQRRHYRLEGAAPGRDDLTGLVDREGFRP